MNGRQCTSTDLSKVNNYFKYLHISGIEELLLEVRSMQTSSLRRRSPRDGPALHVPRAVSPPHALLVVFFHLLANQLRRPAVPAAICGPWPLSRYSSPSVAGKCELRHREGLRAGSRRRSAAPRPDVSLVAEVAASSASGRRVVWRIPLFCFDLPLHVLETLPRRLTLLLRAPVCRCHLSPPWLSVAILAPRRPTVPFVGLSGQHVGATAP